jgi:arabinogalactan oligomer/maltooligosaccharide transport system substrate-binding protein
MKSRRRTLVALLVVAVAGLVAATAGSVHASTKVQPKLVIWTDANRLAAMTSLGNAWGSAHGVTVTVVQKGFGVSGAGNIGGDLATTDLADAPDVITLAHDWTGALASNGLIVPLHLSSSLKKKFIPWTIKAFSFGTAVSNLYAVPTQTENLGLVVNTKLAKVPTSFADLYKQAMAFKKKHHTKVGLAVPDGAPNGDPYHMEPFLTGLCGYVFGYNHAGNFDPSNIGVANKKFLKHASMIDAWNKAGFISSSVDYGTAETMFLKGQIPFWITGPWESSNLTNPKYHLKFKVVHMPKIVCQSTPFLGAQGVGISKYAAQHGVAALASSFVQTYLTTTSAQVALAKANGRLPALTAAVSKVHNKVLSEFAAASTGGQPMPNITQMNSVWTFLGDAWVNSTKGSGATKASVSFKRAQHQIAEAIG